MGDNVYLGDRNGVRTPMQWSPDRNAGFSRASPQRLILPVIMDPEYHYESLNVESQQQSDSSLLWWTKRLVALRKRYRAFGRGSIELLSPVNHRVLAFVRHFEHEDVLVVANLSRHVQFVELDLARWRGAVPVELFGRTRFPPIGDLPYLLTLGGHEFYWFALEPSERAAVEDREAAWQPPAIERWPDVRALEELLPGWLAGRAWFAGRERGVAAARVIDRAELDGAELVFVSVDHTDGPAGHYVVPLTIVPDEGEAAQRARSWHAVLAALPARRELVVDALAEPDACRAILRAVSAGARAPLRGDAAALPEEDLEVKVLRAEYGSAVVSFGGQLFMRVLRRLDEGPSAHVELARGLLGKGAPVPAWRGALEWVTRRGERRTVAIVEEWIASEQDGWSLARGELSRFFARALTRGAPPPAPTGSPVTLAAEVVPDAELEALGPWLEQAERLGQRVAELHRAVCGVDDPVFTPESYSALDQRSAYQSMRNTTGRVLRLLRSRLPELEGDAQARARGLVAREAEILRRFEPLRAGRVTGRRTRCHGDLHLGHVLHTGRDFVFVDLEGDRRKELAERRRKRSPLRDVASLLVSLHAAAASALLDETVVRAEDRAAASPWADVWRARTAALVVRGYLPSAPLLPQDPHELAVLVDAFALERALAELGTALDAGPSWWVPRFLLVLDYLVLSR
jgi:maltose alpha-D-glucosyltransferase/alpha-amylase